MISLDEQIACVRREIALRRSVYPGLIARGKISEEQADIELTRMQTVLLTLTHTYPYALARIKALEQQLAETANGPRS